MNDQSRRLSEEQVRCILDREHLKLLTIGYVWSAAVNTVWSILALAGGTAMVVLLKSVQDFAQAHTQADAFPPPVFLLVGLPVIGTVLFLGLLGLLQLGVAGCLKYRRCRLFCLAVAGLSLPALPFGTMLGIFTFVALRRPSVRLLFTENSNPRSGDGQDSISDDGEKRVAPGGEGSPGRIHPDPEA